MLTLGHLAAYLGANLKGNPDAVVRGLAPLQEAGPEHLTFLVDKQYRKFLPECRAAAVILKAEDAEACPEAALIVSDPYLAYSRVSHLFETRLPAIKGIHPTAVVADDVQIDPTASIGPYVVIEPGVWIGPEVVIGAHCFIGARCRIGEGGRLAPRVTLYHDVVIGQRVVMQSGAVVGGEGFGFAKEKDSWQKIAQLGGVQIGDDVEIGANTTVDRGALSDTWLGNGVKLDNQIMIGHNVQVGDHTAMAACVGISGSSKIGRRCIIGGAVGMAGHLEICDDVFFTGMTMVTRSISKPGAYSSGTGIQPAAEWRRSAARFHQLDDMARRLQQLEKRLAAMTAGDNDTVPDA
ncbi:UDP-3-O-[3-hydroxymyristoyl] glucosamine N-acyltransferase [Azomonas macrocytogenes]|uniref:UDP-3-O-acylglucosamine N-acyltransferase n=1 Tax=Azomonas macrocytogenes TaxID=69962 RepID=A0A839T5F3_AZOMA|nr:UDP-3-O-[3-hydroxymyristoyl] glucosamine N-acyltransferase [Azomonas macrocytogenes]